MCECVFLFKQKTSYEMRMSDWSSDVCSSDLGGIDHRHADQEQQRGRDVDRDIMQARTRALDSRTVQDEAVRRRQQHLEENEQVEDIPGQERAVDPDQ